jgi:aspartate/glutamate racemase
VSLAGLVGGLGPESTIEYYRQIVALWRHRTDGGRAGRRIRVGEIAAQDRR